MKRSILIVALVVSLLLAGCLPQERQRDNLPPTPTFTPTPTPAPTPALPSLSEVVAKVSPAVVYIFVEYIEVDIFGRRFSANKSGSGVILRPEGYILTNKHVVEGFSRVEVTLPDLEVYEPTEVWMDPLLDLAVVKIEGQGFPAASFGDASRLRVGDWVVALGHPLGLSPEEGGSTVTAGIVSNLQRTFTIDDTPYYDVIQTDAAINPGNSGGPLVNLAGEVIGINSAVSVGAENVGFAISANTARPVFEQLVETGRVSRPYLGVTLADVTPSLAAKIGLAVRKGVLVSEVVPNSPAWKAGLRENDVIVTLEGEEMTRATQMILTLWQYKVGQEIRVTFWRGDREMEATLIPTERHQ